MATGVTVHYSEQMCHWSTSSLLIGERHWLFMSPLVALS